MYTNPYTAWLTGLVALTALLVTASFQLDPVASPPPLVAEHAERHADASDARICAGYVSVAALEDCRLGATPMRSLAPSMIVDRQNSAVSPRS